MKFSLPRRRARKKMYRGRLSVKRPRRRRTTSRGIDECLMAPSVILLVYLDGRGGVQFGRVRGWYGVRGALVQAYREKGRGCFIKLKLTCKGFIDIDKDTVRQTGTQTCTDTDRHTDRYRQRDRHTDICK